VMVICGGVHGGLWCCISDRLGCMRGLNTSSRSSIGNPKIFSLFPLFDLRSGVHISIHQHFVLVAFPLFTFYLMYSANCSRPLSPHPSYETSQQNNDEIMFPTSTQLSTFIGLATLIGMCWSVYLLYLLASGNSPKLFVYE
jgi:hypothetical protein